MPAPKGAVAKHRRGALGADALNAQIARTWEELLASDVGREQIAAALGLKPEDIRPQDLKLYGSPFVVDPKPPAGFVDPGTLLIVGKWVATTVVVPIVADLLKDAAQERLTRLWKDVVLPQLHSKKQDVIGESVP